jgi:5-methylcytosine-specific restriction endonuclease McrA
MMPKNISKPWLCREYLELKKNPVQISREYGLAETTIWRKLKKFGIPTRSYSESFLLIRPRGKDSPLYKHGRKSVVCPLCGGKKSRGGCDKCWECYKKSVFGENNHNYKGIADITSITREYSKNVWRPKILRRDNFTCQQCGSSKGANLEAHHIKPLSKIIESFCKGKDLSTPSSRLIICSQLIKSEEVNDLSNGQTLCEKCHKIKHKKPTPQEKRSIIPSEK